MISTDPQLHVANEFLHMAAETIRDAQATEAALRTAISRAYYAVYLSARDQLFGPDGRTYPSHKNQLKQRFRKQSGYVPGSHELCIFAITTVPKKGMLNPITLSQQVAQLKDARTNADYIFEAQNLRRVQTTDWRKYAEDCVALSALLLPMVRRLPAIS